MNDEGPLFRPAAIDARRASTTGAVILAQPVSFACLTLAAVAVGCSIVAYFVWGTYTQHVTLAGRLVADPALIPVHARQQGTIVDKRVAEGDSVERGDVLYVVSGERVSSELGATRALIGVEVRKKLDSLRGEIEKLRELERTQRAALEKMAGALRSESAHLSEMSRSQAARVELVEQTAARYRRLRAQGFVSEEQLIAKREDLLEQRSRLRQLARERSTVARRLAELQSEIRGLPLEYENRTARVERAIASARQELTHNEAERRIRITASAAGIATAVDGEIGRFVAADSRLALIVPHGARLRAKLFAPSRAVGFLSVGDAVRLRYEAYPYQKFGHRNATVTAISRAAVPVAAGGAESGAPSEPMYEVTVEIASQSVTAYGEQRALKPGMIVEADVLQQTRRLYEWVLEPLLTLTGTLH